MIAFLLMACVEPHPAAECSITGEYRVVWWWQEGAGASVDHDEWFVDITADTGLCLMHLDLAGDESTLIAAQYADGWVSEHGDLHVGSAAAPGSVTLGGDLTGDGVPQVAELRPTGR